MKKKKKTTHCVAESGFDMEEQIIRNYQEDYGFADILERFKRNEYVNQGCIRICKTPNVLKLGGADLDLDVIINQKTIVKCMSKPWQKHHGHNLDKDIFKYLVFELRNPVMLLKGSQPGTLVAVTDLMDREGRPVIVSVALNRMNGRHPANQVTSVYGREGFDSYLRRQVRLGNLIAINKKQANRMFQSAGVQFPMEETLISFDNSIAYTLDNVKGFFGKTLENVNDFSVIKDDLQKEFAEIINKLNELVRENEEIIEMIQFFEYAGDEIRNSVLWHQFQQDKEYLSENEFVSRLKDVVLEARRVTNEQCKASQRFTEANVKHEGPKERLGCDATRFER